MQQKQKQRRSRCARFLWLGLVGLLAFVALSGRLPLARAQTGATATAIAMPVDTSVRLKPGKDMDLVAATCAQCHTFKPIVTHDGFTPQQWAQEVQKMRQQYGAQMDDATAARIVAYLQTYYSAPPPSDADFLLGITPSAAASPAASPVASPVASSAASPTASGPVVQLADIKFIPNAFTIPANTPVVVSLVNVGVLPHNFSIDALKISVDVAPGQTRTVTIDAAAGTYQFYCNVPGHKQAGMVGTLTVK